MKNKKKLFLIVFSSILFSSSSFAKKYDTLEDLKKGIGENNYAMLEKQQEHLNTFYKQGAPELLELLNTPYSKSAGGIEELHNKIKDLLVKGADPQKLNNGFLVFNNETGVFNNETETKTIQLLLDNKEKPLNPNHLLRLVINSRFNLNQEKFHELIELALANNADLNSFTIYQYISNNAPIQTVKLLFENHYKKIDPKLFGRFFEKFTCWKMISKYRLNKFYLSPKQYFSSRYKNLNLLNTTTSNTTLKIPRTMHQVWFTNNTEKREIPPEKLIHILNMRDEFSRKDKGWEHIIWTNDRSLIPVSVQILENDNVKIKVKEIKEINEQFKNKELLDFLIETGRFGTAADLANHEIIYLFGGVSTNVDFSFNDNEDLEREIHTYNFFGITDTHGSEIDPYFFAASQKHPLLKDSIDLLYENYKELHQEFFALSEKGLERTTIYGDQVTPIFPHVRYRTVFMLECAYHRTANKYGTTDVLFTGKKYENAEFPADFLKFEYNDNDRTRFLAEYLGILNISDFLIPIEKILPVCFDLYNGKHYQDLYKNSTRDHNFGNYGHFGGSSWRKNGFDRVL